MLKIAVTVCTYNRVILLEQVLTALQDQTISHSEYEIIICDSKSCDGTEKLIKQISEFSPVSITHVNTKNNLAAKRNIGIQSAAAPLIVFLDDDCVPERDFLERYLKTFSHVLPTDKVVYCGEVRYPQQWVKESNYYRFRDSRHYMVSKDDKYNKKLNYKTIVVMNMCFRAEIFKNIIGNVDESFIGYGAEDQELGHRLEQNGFSIMTNSARIYHFENTGTIEAYGDKIRRSSRDGMRTLMRVAPDAAFGIDTLRKIDRDFPNRSIFDFAFSFFIRLILMSNTHIAICHFLSKADRKKIFYIPILYRFVMAVFYLEGSLQRSNSIDEKQAEKGWDQ